MAPCNSEHDFVVQNEGLQFEQIGATLVQARNRVDKVGATLALEGGLKVVVDRCLGQVVHRVVSQQCLVSVQVRIRVRARQSDSHCTVIVYATLKCQKSYNVG